MPKNRIRDLRDSLFETIEKLMDPEDPMDLDRAKAIANVAQTVINSAKVELDFVRITGQTGTDWFTDDRQLLSGANVDATPKQIAAAVTQTEQKLRPLGVSKQNHAELCLSCPLPNCDETSPSCLIQIEIAKPKAVAA